MSRYYRAASRAGTAVLPGNGAPEFFTDPRRGCAPEKVDPDLFYSETAAGRAAAIEICKTQCPFRQRCDAHANATHERWGVWGGRCRDRRLLPKNDWQVHDLWRRRLTDEQIAVEIGCTTRAVLTSRRRQGLFTPGDPPG